MSPASFRFSSLWGFETYAGAIRTNRAPLWSVFLPTSAPSWQFFLFTFLFFLYHISKVAFSCALFSPLFNPIFWCTRHGSLRPLFPLLTYPFPRFFAIKVSSPPTSCSRLFLLYSNTSSLPPEFFPIFDGPRGGGQNPPPQNTSFAVFLLAIF